VKTSNLARDGKIKWILDCKVPNIHGNTRISAEILSLKPFSSKCTARITYNNPLIREANTLQRPQTRTYHIAGVS
jgi:hypothetical protein